MSRLVTIAAMSAAVAVAAGAFGAHGTSGHTAELLKTGAFYQLMHALAVLAITPQWRRPALALLTGSLIFAFSLYALALGAPRWFGAITPIGGLAMITGWLWLAYRSSLSRNAATSSSDTDLST
jgi:uncharacterized membrane protein YgdD (TMEM256/DUF423 family)